jgi:hypothetical protein
LVIPVPWRGRNVDPGIAPDARGFPASRAWLWLASLAVAAILVDLGRMHSGEQADSIVPVLVSLQRWTPMYWDQERFGMLIPLLTLPLRDPLANLLVQRWIQALAGLASVALLARYALGRPTGWVAGLLGVGALLLFLPRVWLFDYLAAQPYGLSIALSVSGLLIARPLGKVGHGRGRLAAGLVLCLLGHWANAVIGLFLIPVALARAAVRWIEQRERDGGQGNQDEGDGGRELLIELALLGAGLVFGQVTVWLYPVLWGYPRQTDLTILPLREWPQSLWVLLQNGWKGAGPTWPVALALTALLGLLLPWPRVRGGAVGTRRTSLLRVAVLVVAALPNAVAMASLRWVVGNLHHWRYLSPSLVLIHVAVMSLLAEPLLRLRVAASGARATVLFLPVLAALVVYGPPSMRQVRADLNATLGTRTEDVLAAGCDLVAGNYWSVWPTVWHAGWVAHERGLPTLYGLTGRARPTVPLWAARSREALRVCRVRGEEADSEQWLRLFDLWPVREVATRRSVIVVAPVTN